MVVVIAGWAIRSAFFVVLCTSVGLLFGSLCLIPCKPELLLLKAQTQAIQNKSRQILGGQSHNALSLPPLSLLFGCFVDTALEHCLPSSWVLGGWKRWTAGEERTRLLWNDWENLSSFWWKWGYELNSLHYSLHLFQCFYGRQIFPTFTFLFFNFM